MPLGRYSVLKGRPVDVRRGGEHARHYQIHVMAGREEHRVAVNVRSDEGHDVEYLVRAGFDHPITDELAALAPGLHRLRPGDPGPCLDYIRGNLMQPHEPEALPHHLPGRDNDLNDALDRELRRAIDDPAAMLHAFGDAWGPEPGATDELFGFTPGRGLHEVHMNQGNPPPPWGREGWYRDNAPWQDGGLVLHRPGADQWVAIFLRFQSQAWHTHDRTGRPLPAGSGPPPASHRIEPGHAPTRAQPDGMVRVAAAIVNGGGVEEAETVTLHNGGAQPVDLSGWSLADRVKRRMPLAGPIGPGQSRSFPVLPPLELSNQGGLITLLNQRGVKVHGVAYTRGQASRPGRMVRFDRQ